MKKIILFVVEGPSEQIALEGIFHKLLQTQNEDILFELAYHRGGDILQSTQAISDIITTIKDYLAEKKFIPEDLKEVILLSDIDGCYIKDDDVIEQRNSKIKYMDNTILCADKRHIVSRNRNKRSSVEQLIQTHHLMIDDHSIDFKILFVSCNFDHILYNERNLMDRQKTHSANQFALNFIDREGDFIPFIKSFTLEMNESDLWEYLKVGNHSLSRCSTLYFLFRGYTNGNQ